MTSSLIVLGEVSVMSCPGGVRTFPRIRSWLAVAGIVAQTRAARHTWQYRTELFMLSLRCSPPPLQVRGLVRVDRLASRYPTPYNCRAQLKKRGHWASIGALPIQTWYCVQYR